MDKKQNENLIPVKLTNTYTPYSTNNMHTFMYGTPTFITEVHSLYYSSTAAFSNCYSELVPYTALANSY